MTKKMNELVEILTKFDKAGLSDKVLAIWYQEAEIFVYADGYRADFEELFGAKFVPDYKTYPGSEANIGWHHTMTLDGIFNITTIMEKEDPDADN